MATSAKLRPSDAAHHEARLQACRRAQLEGQQQQGSKASRYTREWFPRVNARSAQRFAGSANTKALTFSRRPATLVLASIEYSCTPPVKAFWNR